VVGALGGFAGKKELTARNPARCVYDVKAGAIWNDPDGHWASPPDVFLSTHQTPINLGVATWPGSPVFSIKITQERLTVFSGSPVPRSGPTVRLPTTVWALTCATGCSEKVVDVNEVQISGMRAEHAELVRVGVRRKQTHPIGLKNDSDAREGGARTD